MSGLTLDKEIEIINENLIKIANEYFGKQSIQNLPKNSKK